MQNRVNELLRECEEIIFLPRTDVEPETFLGLGLDNVAWRPLSPNIMTQLEQWSGRIIQLKFTHPRLP